jgi:putative FmdB family regulatory protein
MPVYEFSCSKCKHSFEVSLTFSDFDKLGKKKQAKCPQCKAKKYTSICISEPAYCSVVNINTIGQLAEKNIKKVGQTKIQELEAKKADILPKNKKTPPWYGKLGTDNAKKLFSGSKKEQRAKIRKYVREGEL